MSAIIAGAVVGSAVIGAGASMYASSKASDASSEAAAAQSSAQTSSTAMQMAFLREQRADIADAVEKGLIDLDSGFNMAIQELQPYTGMEEYNTARNLLNDPNAIMDRPSTQFQYGVGMEALKGQTSMASGGGVSGRSMKAAMEYGQNFASQALDTELNRLFPFINMASSARSNIAGMEVSRGTSKANLRVGGAAGLAGATGAASSGIAAGIQNQGNIAAANAINQGNIAGANAQNIGGMFSNMAMTYAMNPSMFSGGGGTNAGLFNSGASNNYSALPIG